MQAATSEELKRFEAIVPAEHHSAMAAHINAALGQFDALDAIHLPRALMIDFLLGLWVTTQVADKTFTIGTSAGSTLMKDLRLATELLREHGLLERVQGLRDRLMVAGVVVPPRSLVRD